MNIYLYLYIHIYIYTYEFSITVYFTGSLILISTMDNLVLMNLGHLPV